MKNKKLKKFIKIQDDGWTLMETLVVMTIVMVLTASVGVSAVGQIDKAKCLSARTQIEAYSMALDNFYIDTGCYPSEADGLSFLWNDENKIYGEKWKGPYITKRVGKDPWGNDFVYRCPGKNYSFEIISYGRDGMEGGSGVNGDIISGF